MLARLSQSQRAAEAYLAEFDFSHLVDELYHLTFDDFCDWYAEAIKQRLYDGDADARATATRRAGTAAEAAASGDAARDRGDLVVPAGARLAADRRAVARGRRRHRSRCVAARPGGGAMFRRSRRAAEARRETRSASSTRSSARARAERRTATSTPSVRGCARRSSAPRSSSPTSASSRTPRPTSSMRSGRSSSATGVSSMQSATEWLASLSPWPRDGFGLDRMNALLDRLGHPRARLSTPCTSSARRASRRRRARSRRCSVPRAARVPPTRHRTSPAGASGSRPTPTGSSARSPACAPTPKRSARRSSRC